MEPVASETTSIEVQTESTETNDTDDTVSVASDATGTTVVARDVRLPQVTLILNTARFISLYKERFNHARNHIKRTKQSIAD